MQQSFADRSDGEELMDTKLEVYIRQTADYGPPKYASNVWYVHNPAE